MIARLDSFRMSRANVSGINRLVDEITGPVFAVAIDARMDVPNLARFPTLVTIFGRRVGEARRAWSRQCSARSIAGSARAATETPRMRTDGQHAAARRRSGGPDATVRCRTRIGIARSTSLVDVFDARATSR
jgi:hypothetical protein